MPKVPARQYFEFVLRAFLETEGHALSMQPYLFYVSYWIAKLWRGAIKTLVINLPPKHLKTFIGTVCLVCWELAHRPRSDIIVVTCSEELAEDIAKSIVAVLATPWFIAKYGSQLKRRNVDPTNFRTRQGGSVHVIAVGSAMTGLRADLIIFDDPHELRFMQNLKKIEAVKDIYRRAVRTRFKHPSRGRLLLL